MIRFAKPALRSLFTLVFVADTTRYGYQSWIPQDATEGTWMARVVYGQYIRVDTARGMVIAWHCRRSRVP